MIYPKRHYQVNWVDGMKISKQHFIHNDQYVTDSVRDSMSVRLSTFEFGLLPVAFSKETFLLEASEKSDNSIELKLKKCEAITEGGTRISIDSKELPLVAKIQGKNEFGSTNSEVVWFEVLLKVNPFVKVPTGIPNAEENPPRHPFSDFSYSLEIIPSLEIQPVELGPNFLIIGKIKSVGGKPTYIQDFIPPCSSIKSHPALIGAYDNFAAKINQLHVTSFKIIKKIYEKPKPSSIARNFKLLCEKLMDFSGGHSFQFKNILSHTAPIYLVDYFSSMANVMLTTLQCISPDEREELIKYLFEWCEIAPKDFEEALIEIADKSYDHYAIHDSIRAIHRFLDTIHSIWKRMDSLEFIGQHKENIVVTKETIQPSNEAPKKRWSILD